MHERKGEDVVVGGVVVERVIGEGFRERSRGTTTTCTKNKSISITPTITT